MVALTAGFKSSLCAACSLLVSVSSFPWVPCVPVPQRGQLCTLALPKNCNIATSDDIFSSLKSCSKKLHKIFFVIMQILSVSERRSSFFFLL